MADGMRNERSQFSGCCTLLSDDTLYPDLPKVFARWIDRNPPSRISSSYNNDQDQHHNQRQNQDRDATTRQPVLVFPDDLSHPLDPIL